MSERVPVSLDSIYANRTSKISRYRPEIDGLRAFAVVAVIINHFNKEILPGGYLGVDIFFVISGYVITSSLFERPSKDFKDFISGFYERRIKRLVPALSVFVLITSIFICLFNPSPGLSLHTGVTSLFGLSNLYLLKQSTDYFAQSTELNVFTHTWSLGVEEQFYILFPFLIWFSGFVRQTKNGARNLFLVVGVLTIASLVGFLYLYQANQPAAYFLMPSRFWEMAAGCLIFIGFQKRASIEQFLEKVPPLLVMALIVGVMYLPMSMAAASTIAVVALSSILIACLKIQTAAFKVFTNPKVVYVGLISYSLYLWHWGVLSISRWTIGIHWWSMPFQVALMLGLAVASYRYIETPLRKGNWFGKRWKTLVVGGGVLVTVSGGLVALGKPLKGKLYASDYKFDGLITRSRNYDGSKGNYNGKNCHLSDDRLDKISSFANCYLRPERQEHTFYFAGNSHTDHFRELHYRLNSEHGLGVFSVSISGCLFAGDPHGDCKNSQTNIEKYILDNLKKGDTAVISNRHITNSDKNTQNLSDYKWLTSKQSIEKINVFASKVKSKGGNLILFTPTPEFDTDIQRCKPEWFKPLIPENCHKSLEEAQEEAKEAYALLEKYLDRQILIYDPMLSICQNKTCSITDKNSKPLYVDGDHLTDYANSEYIFPDFVSFLRSKGLLSKSN
jgi:peptidoglycan/LPS O-acetylase OafA/YrhL